MRAIGSLTHRCISTSTSELCCCSFYLLVHQMPDAHGTSARDLAPRFQLVLGNQEPTASIIDTEDHIFHQWFPLLSSHPSSLCPSVTSLSPPFPRSLPLSSAHILLKMSS